MAWLRKHIVLAGAICAMGAGTGALLYYGIRCFSNRPTSNSPASRPSVAMFEGGYLTLMKDSDELVNTSNRTKLLYRVEIRPPDPEAVIATINVAGTELGEGSFIRVVALDLEGNPIRTRTEDYKRVHLENSLYKRISVYECQVVLELWGAPGTRNRLRVNRVRYFYPGRPIEPDVPPGAPRPARGIDYPRSADGLGWGE
jgi:hypothetical protein